MQGWHYGGDGDLLEANISANKISLPQGQSYTEGKKSFPFVTTANAAAAANDDDDDDDIPRRSEVPSQHNDAGRAQTQTSRSRVQCSGVRLACTQTLLYFFLLIRAPADV